jgi:hypothetical protein
MCIQICQWWRKSGQQRQTDVRNTTNSQTHGCWNFKSFWIWRSFVQWLVPHVSKGRSASIFNVQTVKLFFNSLSMSIKIHGYIEMSDSTHPKTHRHTTKKIKSSETPLWEPEKAHHFLFITWKVTSLPLHNVKLHNAKSDVWKTYHVETSNARSST